MNVSPICLKQLPVAADNNTMRVNQNSIAERTAETIHLESRGELQVEAMILITFTFLLDTLLL